MKKIMIILFPDMNSLMKGLPVIKGLGMKIIDVYSPVPVFGLKEYLHYGKTGIPGAGLWGGVSGALFALVLQYYATVIAYPLWSGGKPIDAVMPFFPVLFECIVLGAGLSMFFAFIIRSRMGSRTRKKLIHHQVSDDVFAVEVVNTESLPADVLQASFENSTISNPVMIVTNETDNDQT